MGFCKGFCSFCAVAVAVLAGIVGLLTQPLHMSLRPLQIPAVRYFEGIIDRLQLEGGTHTPWVDEFSGGFVPTANVHGAALAVKRGAVPDVEGVYLRVGPNLQKFPAAKRTHVFDGDGMLYTVRLAKGKATYHAAYLETPRYMYEKATGHEWFMRIGELHGWLGMLKLFTTFPKKSEMVGIAKLDSGNANTAVGFTPEGKLWALNEAARPFRFRLQQDGSVQSLGFDHLDGTLQSAVSAHPKYDYRTGETFYHGKELMKRFYAGRIKDGKVVEEAQLPVKDGFQHDMFITRDYAVIVDGSSRFNPKNVAKKKPLWQFDEGHSLRFGIADRSKPMTTENFIWIEAPVAAEIVHTCYGWNEGSTIKLFTPMAFKDPNQTDGVLAGMTGFSMKLVTIDVAQGAVVVEDVEGGEEFSTEFCRVRDDAVGGKTRYAFSAVQGSGDDSGIAGFNFTGILKWDMHERKRVGHIKFPADRIGGEPIFIPAGPGDDEGYVSMFFWDMARKSSTFVLYDARTFDNEPTVELQAPIKVPLGFHGWWLSEAQFQQQLQ